MTLPPPSGFVPVRDTLPSGAYNFKGPCKLRSLHTTFTYTSYTPPVSTLTSSLPTYIIDGTKSYTDPASFTSFSIVFTSSIITSTQYASTVTVLTPTGTTKTVTAGTTTIEGQCATTNWANEYILPGRRSSLPFWFPQFNDTQNFVVRSAAQNAYECCVAAFAEGADAWIWSSTYCAFTTDTNFQDCEPKAANFGAYYGTVSADPTITVGNGPCGSFTRATESPGF